MSSTTVSLGLSPGNLAPYHIIFHFFFAYAALSSRGTKNYLKIDHNVNPRSDVRVYGQRALTEGKITKRQFALLERNEACHANAMESFPVFVAASLFATIAGVAPSEINYGCTVYTVSRLAYAVAYLAIEDYKLSYVRSLLWWVANYGCLSLLWAAGQAFNGAK